MKSSNVYYNPSLVGRLGRVIIPALQRALPTSIYKVTYDLLYNSYKKALNYSYAFNLINARLSGNKKKNLRSDLTFKLLPYTMGGYKALENAFNVIDLIEENKLDGVIIECGVAEGRTAAMLSMASLKLGLKGKNGSSTPMKGSLSPRMTIISMGRPVHSSDLYQKVHAWAPLNRLVSCFSINSILIAKKHI